MPARGRAVVLAPRCRRRHAANPSGDEGSERFIRTRGRRPVPGTRQDGAMTETASWCPCRPSRCRTACTHGEGGPGIRAAVLPRCVGAGARPGRSDCAPDRAGDDPGPRPRAAAPRAHARLPVHLLPRRGRDHGGRSGHARRTRAPGPGVRRRAPLQLRGVRGSRSGTHLRHQRLRRDQPGTVRVGRQAARRELRDRGEIAVVHEPRRPTVWSPA